MKRFLFCFVVLAVLGVAVPTIAEEAVSTAELELLLAQPESEGPQISMPEPFLAARCPTYAPACSTNVQCDSWCGTPGWGVCQWLQSAGRRCCYCLG